MLDAIGQPDGSDRQVGKHFTDLLKYVEGDYNNVETFKTMRSAWIQQAAAFLSRDPAKRVSDRR